MNVVRQGRIARCAALALIALIMVAGLAHADASGPIQETGRYTATNLSAWRGRIEADLRWNFDTALLGTLSRAQRARLGSVELALPLHGPGEMRRHPMAFASGGGKVVLPMISLRFLTDIAIASAYLAETGYNLETISDYALMLKYQVFPGRRPSLPPPLEALMIPADHMSRPWVQNTAEKLQKSALIWIMAHEVGHLFYHHPGYGPGVSRVEAQHNEMEADRFADDMMRRIGIPPIGMASVFLVMAHLTLDRGDFASDERWDEYRRFEATHPVTAERLKNMAQRMLEEPEAYLWREPNPEAAIPVLRASANMILKIAETLSSADIQRLITLRARDLSLDALRPRRAMRGQP